MRARRIRAHRGLPAVLGVLVFLLAPGAATGHGAHAARACAVPRYPGSGYFTSLAVRRTTCATGRRVALAYYRCRIKHGVAGRCHRDVLRFSCHEIRQSIPTEIDARVTCRRGGQRVIHTYQQDT
jgi:hypothetical protein